MVLRPLPTWIRLRRCRRLPSRQCPLNSSAAAPFTKWKGLAPTILPFSGGRGHFMSFARFVCCAFAASMLLVCAVVDGRAAGAFSVGQCGAYGYAYDYSEAEAARQAATSKCQGECTTIPVFRACAAFAVDATNAC